MSKYTVKYSQNGKEFSTDIVASEFKLAATMIYAMAVKNGYEVKSVQDSNDF